jgi:thiosulfate/3-mercaptopyruvate sulfurtransferase
MPEDNGLFVTRDWLQEHLGQPGLSIIDGSWYLPAHKRDARAEYEAGHIPGAVFFDHDKSVEPGSSLPHALPTPETFARLAGSMGVAASDTIVVYDGFGLFSSARVWWMFRTMGARNVRVLEGGLDKWREEGRPLTAKPTKIAPCVFDAHFDAARLATLEDMRGIVGADRAQIADARSAGRFSGAEPEPRAGVRSGHMPGARNLPYATLSKDGALLPPDELKARFDEAGIDLDRPVVTTCGSGVSAAVIIMALEALGHRDHRLYDGSWAEWGTRDDTQIATGEA